MIIDYEDHRRVKARTNWSESFLLTSRSIHRSAGYQTPFNEFVRITAHDFAIFTSSWFAFVCINHQVFRAKYHVVLKLCSNRKRRNNFFFKERKIWGKKSLTGHREAYSWSSISNLLENPRLPDLGVPIPSFLLKSIRAPLKLFLWFCTSHLFSWHPLV